jgi:hypothetical protein
VRSLCGTAGRRSGGGWALWRSGAALASAGLAVAVLAGCGFDVQSADLFLLTRTGQGRTLTMLVNDGGTIRCDGAKAKPLSNALLIQARDLAEDLDPDSTKGLSIARTPGTVFYYRIKLQQGTVSFPDLAARGRKVLSEATLFAAQAAQGACGLSG